MPMRFYIRAPVDNPHRLSEDAPVIHRRKGRFVKLYMVPLAPNPTKVMLYIAEREALGTAMPIEQIVVNTLKGRHREPEHIARNPFGTLIPGQFLSEILLSVLVCDLSVNIPI